MNLSKKILRTLGRANAQYNLIGEGDRVLLGLSGGKDSISLAHALKHMSRHAPFKFEYKALTIGYGIEEDFTYLESHCKEHGIPHEIYRSNIMEIMQENVRDNSSICSFCARMRRGSLYTYALEHGYNKVALGHHLDDAAESFFMNLFYNGSMRSMPPIYRAYNDLLVIRPMIKVRERQLREFVKENDITVFSDCNCPAKRSDNPKKPYARERVKEMLHAMEGENHDLFKMINAAFENIHADTFFAKEYFKLDSSDNLHSTRLPHDRNPEIKDFDPSGQSVSRKPSEESDA